MRIDGLSYGLHRRFVPRLQFIVLILWLATTVGLSLIGTDDRLIFFFLGTRLGMFAHVFWWIYLFCASFGLVIAVCVRNLERATVWIAILLVAVAAFQWGMPIDDGVNFRLRLPAYRAFLARADEGHCSLEDAWKLGIQLDALACDKPRLFVFLWDGIRVVAWNDLR